LTPPVLQVFAVTEGVFLTEGSVSGCGGTSFQGRRGMAAKTLGTHLARRYSHCTLRSLIAMVARRALRLVNGTAGGLLVKPLVVMAARTLGPGPTRLKLVKLAHNLGKPGALVERPGLAYVEEPTQRAA
jgi:hypothetical protein